ncbi:GTP cyclohydrolase II [Roseomonas marmotae]|uniref:GTP cyclohydrolase-2 n=1 Tax=Roseomonas marmotae TaxID=2768161 RepID=A0ABS3KD97_9PROT|nr:GTP cyclohydrolase II [Roseomonas marmotae]MBO1074972.1 GTP cyclohydrolase II [Roseomonas marmotae]QTI79988.1 GTP cyclohydrolase II [Roseomonas marmotae]
MTSTGSAVSPGNKVETQGTAHPHDPEPGALVPDAVSLAQRRVHRAASDLRRGTPVLLRGTREAAGCALLVAAAETVGARGLAELAALGAAPPLLLLAPSRAAAVLHRPIPSVPSHENRRADEVPVALTLPPGLLDPERLRGLADPVAEQLLPETPELATAPPLSFAALALAKLGRLLPALVAVPVAEKRVPEAAPLGLFSLPASEILAYPTSAATSLTRVAEARVPLEDAPEARIVAFRAADGGIEHLAILVGDPEGLAAAGGAPLVRIHSECFTGDLLGSLRCDCGPQLRGAIARMGKDGAGVLLYLAQEGRGIGLVNKLRAYTLQDQGLDTLDANRALGYGADERGFMVAATMLRQLGITRLRLLTNNPDKLAGLAACGIDVVGREPHQFAANGINDHYLETKATRFGHLLR